MKDTSTHEALLVRLNNTSIRFGGLQLEFLRGFTHRPDNKVDETFNEDMELINNKNSNRCMVEYEEIDMMNKSTPKRRRQSNEKEIIDLEEEDVVLQQEYQMAISRSQQAFIKSKLDAIKKREANVVTKEKQLKEREAAVKEQEKWVADKKIIVNTAQKTLKDLKNKFLKVRWEYEANVITTEKAILKKKRENFTAQVINMQDAIDLEAHGIEWKQFLLDSKLKAIKDEEDKLAQQKEKSKETTYDHVQDNLKQ
jgi:hypothetical protein